MPSETIYFTTDHYHKLKELVARGEYENMSKAVRDAVDGLTEDMR